MKEDFVNYAKAGYGGIFVETQEEHQVMAILRNAATESGWGFHTWKPTNDETPQQVIANTLGYQESQDRSGSEIKRQIVVLCNVEDFFREYPDLAQMLADSIHYGKSLMVNIVMVSAQKDLPPMLKRKFVHLDYSLPSHDELIAIVEDLGFTCDDIDAVARAASGLTRDEAEDAVALSFIKNNQESVIPEHVWKMKAQQIRETGSLELYDGKETFDDLVGLDGMKEFCKKSVGHPDAKGILAMGVPGAGKSFFAKALGNETGYPTVVWDISACLGSLVGQSEAAVRTALKVIDRISPCILFVDEIEKALSGASGSNDSGVSERILGTLLTWMNDRKSSVYFIGTCNDIEKLTALSAGAFVRSERFDGIFFIGMPTKAQRIAMWEMYIEQFGLETAGEEGHLNLADLGEWLEGDWDEGWTGAEIKSCCRLASMQGISLDEAKEKIIPVKTTAEESIDRLTEWSHKRALDANTGEKFKSDKFVDKGRQVG